MTERMDVLATRSYTTRDGESKTAFTKIGTAWANSKGWSITFDALPLPQINDKGVMETRVLMMPPRDDTRPGAPAGRQPGADADDIPFAPEWR